MNSYKIKQMYEANKSLGQNFLTDFGFIAKMIDVLDVRTGDIVVEIGPGLGALTEEVAQRYLGFDYKFYAVEIDSRFIPKLEQMYFSNPNIVVVQADILDWLPKFVPEKEFKILGALPFYITSPIIHGIIKMKKMPQSCVLLTQDEVAQKVAAVAPDASYMSVFVQTFYSVEYITKVPREVFTPVPQVNGAIIKLVKKPRDFSLDFINRYEEFLHKGFQFPRKMINKAFSKEELSRGGIDATLRPEAVSVDKWLEFFEVLN